MISLVGLLTEGSALTDSFLRKVQQWENSIRSGWNAKKKLWFPHRSFEGGTDTIAYGHKLTQSDIDSGRFTNGITEASAIQLLKTDLYAASKKAKKLVPEYSTFPDNVRQALINATYRGELKSTHRTVKLMNAGKWKAASAEYLNNAEYKSGTGVKDRMDWNHAQFLTMADKPVKTDTVATTTKIYVVKSGDTLGGIANRNNTTIPAIMKKNPKLNPDKIQPGQKISL